MNNLSQGHLDSGTVSKNRLWGGLRPLASAKAFTLIELLVVIAVIALLASMIFPITGALNKHKVRAKARAELALLESAIETYKLKMGHYPPDNPTNHIVNPLYFELSGTKQVGLQFETLDGRGRIRTNSVVGKFGVGGFVNMTRGGGDEGVTAQKFINNLKPAQMAQIPGGPDETILILTCSVKWPNDPNYPIADLMGTGKMLGVNPWRYNSSHPVNNPNGFDLWVDVVVGGKTNRVCNWSKEPLIVGSPL